MRDEFAVDESGMTADGYHILLPVSKKAMYVNNVIKFAILAVVFGVIIHYADSIFGADAELLRTLILGLYVVIIAYLIVSPIIFYRRYRYRLDSEKAEIRRGVITITHSLVPIERIHQVQVNRDPINRMFGLANVTITTAGGVSVIEYLDEATAESIADTLNETVVKLLKDRDQDGN